VYIKHETDGAIYLAIWVDDLFLVGKNIKRLEETKEELMSLFDMADLGDANFILGISIHRNRGKKEMYMDQSHYIQQVLEKFNMEQANPCFTPMDTNLKLTKEMQPKTEEDKTAMRKIPYRELVGSLMYVMVGTRPDIAFAVSCLSKYMENPGEQHWAAAKRVLRYLQGTKKTGLVYYSTGNLTVEGFCDADWAGDLSDRKSTSGYVFIQAGGAVSWKSKRQLTVALSTAEAEYMATANATSEALWLRMS
jgi:Reverse transcriptase (RNA-dependent DNA polymerase)